MDVDAANFDAIAPFVERLLATCDFVSMDQEMTGISSRDAHTHFGMTGEESYGPKRAVATRYTAFQIGLCIFHRKDNWSAENDAARTKGGQADRAASRAEGTTQLLLPEGPFIAHPFNFWLRQRGPRAQDVVVSLPAVDFLLSNGMDFQRWLTRGMAYMTAGRAAEVSAKTLPVLPALKKAMKPQDKAWIKAAIDAVARALTSGIARLAAGDTEGLASLVATDVKLPPAPSSEAVWMLHHQFTEFLGSLEDWGHEVSISSRMAVVSVAESTECAADIEKDASGAVAIESRGTVAGEAPTAPSTQTLEATPTVKPPTPLALFRSAFRAFVAASGSTRQHCAVPRVFFPALLPFSQQPNPETAEKGWRKGGEFHVELMTNPAVAQAYYDDVRNTARDSLAKQVGFRRIVEALFRATRLRRVPFVGHNFSSDLMFFFHQHVTPLPESYADFKRLVHDHMPVIVDTKVLSSVLPFPRIYDTSLGGLYASLCQNQHYGITLPAGFERCSAEVAAAAAGLVTADKGGAAHEAAYDAFMTGAVLLGMQTLFHLMWEPKLVAALRGNSDLARGLTGRRISSDHQPEGDSSPEGTASERTDADGSTIERSVAPSHALGPLNLLNLVALFGNAHFMTLGGASSGFDEEPMAFCTAIHASVNPDDRDASMGLPSRESLVAFVERELPAPPAHWSAGCGQATTTGAAQSTANSLLTMSTMRYKEPSSELRDLFLSAGSKIPAPPRFFYVRCTPIDNTSALVTITPPLSSEGEAALFGRLASLRRAVATSREAAEAEAQAATTDDCSAAVRAPTLEVEHPTPSSNLCRTVFADAARCLWVPYQLWKTQRVSGRKKSRNNTQADSAAAAGQPSACSASPKDSTRGGAKRGAGGSGTADALPAAAEDAKAPSTGDVDPAVSQAPQEL